MTIKELLRAHRLPALEPRMTRTIGSRAAEFDLIGRLARRIRAVRKGRVPTDGTEGFAALASKPGKSAQ